LCRAKDRRFSLCCDDCCVVGVGFGQSRAQTMFLGHKTPRLFGIKPLEQLYTDAVHLGSMNKNALFLPSFLQRDRSRVQAIMAGLAERQEMRLVVAALLATENEVVDAQASDL